MEGAAAASGNTTEDSQGSRPKRALPRFDYNVLNGTSGNLNAMLHAAGETFLQCCICSSGLNPENPEKLLHGSH